MTKTPGARPSAQQGPRCRESQWSGGSCLPCPPARAEYLASFNLQAACTFSSPINKSGYAVRLVITSATFIKVSGPLHSLNLLLFYLRRRCGLLRHGRFPTLSVSIEALSQPLVHPSLFTIHNWQQLHFAGFHFLQKDGFCCLESLSSLS